jgi:hypothetical protein
MPSNYHHNAGLSSPILTCWPLPPPLPYRTYKSEPPPLVLPAPFTPSLQALSTVATKLLFHHRFITVTRLSHYRPSPSEAGDGILVLPSPFSTPAGELSFSVAVEGPALVSAPPRPGVLVSVPSPVHGGPCDPAVVHHPWTESMGFPIKKFIILFYLRILQRGP